MSDEHAIVTGAGSGIGKTAVQRLRRRGALVTAVDLDTTLAALYAGDTGVTSMVGDVTDPGFCETVVKGAEERQPVTQLFHSAGIMPGGELGDVDGESILRVMNVNYGGTVNMVKATLPAMRRRQRGQVVILGSATGYFPSNKLGAYSASKSAVNTFGEVLAVEEKKNGIHVLLVAPNAVKTPLLRQAIAGPATIAKVADGKVPMGLTTDKVLDSIERGLGRKRSVVLPGARAVYLLRRISPRLTWYIVGRINK